MGKDNSNKIWFLIVTLLFICSLFCFAEQEINQKINYLALNSDVDLLITRIMKENNIPAISIGISYPDGSVYVKGFGKINLENGTDNNSSSIFEIGSISKTFTAVAILLLHQEGKLKVSDKIAKYLPDFPNGDFITIKQLLQHTSGLKELTEIEPFKSNQDKNWTPQELMKMIAAEPLDFEPGQSVKYSNSGCIVLGMIIERISGMNYNDFINKYITEPLGMENTFLGSNSKIIGGRAAGYADVRGTLVNAEYASISSPYASGGIISNVIDLVKLKEIFKPGVILAEENIIEMCKPAELNNGGKGILNVDNDKLTYGYGLDMFFYNGYYLPGKAGSISGFNSYFAYFKDINAFVIITSNLDNSLSPVIKTVFDIGEIIKERRLKGVGDRPFSQKDFSNR